ncbi:putative toxin-antitoxin system toxin component, PIN family [Candidatus Fermentibacteria bacterium]|nr:MAG: putative toxin-antitoxin system toxin component, PIN family [Candidatus Fermentibacteria bacterium]PIE53702.1 MAG: putative toxin-antitoxin system toxin component, PIN family [Candidatus Fermentibacteria bacterium]
MISAVFFKGKPDVILEAWRAGILEIILSAEILDEYSEVLKRLSKKYPTIDVSGILSVFASGCRIVEPEVIGGQICDDADDDKFLAAAIGGDAGIVISGDKHLLDVNGYSGIEILRSTEFIDKYLSEQSNAVERR